MKLLLACVCLLALALPARACNPVGVVAAPVGGCGNVGVGYGGVGVSQFALTSTPVFVQPRAVFVPNNAALLSSPVVVGNSSAVAINQRFGLFGRVRSQQIAVSNGVGAHAVAISGRRR